MIVDINRLEYTTGSFWERQHTRRCALSQIIKEDFNHDRGFIEKGNKSNKWKEWYQRDYPSNDLEGLDASGVNSHQNHIIDTLKKAKNRGFRSVKYITLTKFSI